MNTNDISYLHSEAFNNGHLKDDYKAIISFYTLACIGFDYLKIYGFEENNIMIEEYPSLHNALISDEGKMKIIFENNELKKYQFQKTMTMARALDTLERILRYQKNIYEECTSTSKVYLEIKLYHHKTLIYNRTYRAFSDYYRDEKDNLVKHKTLLSFWSLQKKCLDNHLNNAFHEDKRLKYENKQRYIVDMFIQSLSILSQHKEKVGLALYTSINKELFYVYKNENDTVFIKPQKGKTEFSIPRKRIEEIYINRETKQSNDKAYILPICEFLDDHYIGSGDIDFIGMPFLNPFRMCPIKFNATTRLLNMVMHILKKFL